MKTEELKNLIIEKQDEYITYLLRVVKSENILKDITIRPRYEYEEELDALKHQLKESELAPVENVSDYLNDCIEKAAPNLSKIEDVDKELAEIRGGKRNCYNCKYEHPDSWGNPCNMCNDFKKWEPKLKQVESEPVKESAEISDEYKKCENCKYYFSNLYDKYPCSQCNWGEYNLKWEPKTE